MLLFREFNEDILEAGRDGAQLREMPAPCGNGRRKTTQHTRSLLRRYAQMQPISKRSHILDA
jgi:hypothetical protein